MLGAQALEEQLPILSRDTLLSRDPLFEKYPGQSDPVSLVLPIMNAI